MRQLILSFSRYRENHDWLLAYMQIKLLVLACTDPNTDIGKVIVDGGFGWWCESNEVNVFSAQIQNIINYSTERLHEMGCCGFDYLKEHYTSEIAYRKIMEKL